MAADHRENWILREGDCIHCSDVVYRISGVPIGYGGSAVVYPAERADTRLHYAIKECFPKDGSYRRENGVIVPQDPADAASAQLLERIRSGIMEEQRISQLVYNTGERAVCIREILSPKAITFRGETHSQVGGSCFAVLDRMDLKAKTFYTLLREIREGCSAEELRRTRGLPDIQTTALLMAEVLAALQQVHNATDPDAPEVSGYHYCDLHGGNIYFTGSRIREGIVGKASLIDFGSARPLDRKGRTERIPCGEIFAAAGFRPPEAMDGPDTRLTRCSDIFSLGCLMLRCVATTERIESVALRPCVGRNFLSLSDGAYIGCGPERLKLVNSILMRATAEDPEERYPDTASMLLDIQKLLPHSAQQNDQLSLSLPTLAKGTFVGRDRDLKELDRYLSSRCNPIILHGFPGIGKTELAIEFGRRKLQTGQVFFVRFTDSFARTITGPIADAFSGYSKRDPEDGPKPEDRVYREVLQMLGRYTPDDLLIIDHVDIPGGSFSDLRTEAYHALCKLPMQLMLTTRCEPDGVGQWRKVGPLGKEHLYKLIRRYAALTEAQMDQLIAAVDAHTLTLDVMARTIAQSWASITPETLLKVLRTGGERSQLPLVSTTHDRSGRQDRFYGHLKTLFDLSSMHDDEITVLCCATLLPDDGMNAALFQSGLAEEPPELRGDGTPRLEQTALLRLTKAGWLTVSDENRLRIHPVIREACRAQFLPDNDRCGGFLQRLWERCNAGDREAWKDAQTADCFARALSLAGARKLFLASTAAELCRRAGLYQKTKEYAGLALEIGRKQLSPTDLNLASLYADMGSACGDLGEFDHELEYHKQALHIRQASLPPDDPDIALSYSCIGSSYGALGNLQLELDYQQKALQIRRRALPADHPALGDSYSRVGRALCLNGNLREGLSCLRQALTLQEAAQPRDHAALAITHGNIAKALCDQQRYSEAVDHLQCALDIRCDLVPESHSDLAQCHYSLALVHEQLGRRKEALEHHQHRLEHLRAFLDGENPRLIEACYDISRLYGKLGQRDAQRTYLCQAARAGHAEAVLQLSQQLSWLEQAVERGDLIAANNLGIYCLRGIGTPRDIERGIRLLTMAADGSVPAAMRHLGRIYLGVHSDVPGYPRDPSRALFYLEKVRELGGPGDAKLIRLARKMLDS